MRGVDIFSAHLRDKRIQFFVLHVVHARQLHHQPKPFFGLNGFTQNVRTNLISETMKRRDNAFDAHAFFQGRSHFF